MKNTSILGLILASSLAFSTLAKDTKQMPASKPTGEEPESQKPGSTDVNMEQAGA